MSLITGKVLSLKTTFLTKYGLSIIELEPEEIDSEIKNQGNIPETSQSTNGIPSSGADLNPT